MTPTSQIPATFTEQINHLRLQGAYIKQQPENWITAIHLESSMNTGGDGGT
jgi:hypothetical protein